MERIDDFQQIRDIFANTKTQGVRLLTNFYMPETRGNLLINNKLLFMETIDQTTFILHLDRGFYHLSFFATDIVALKNDLQSLVAKYPNLTFVTDIIGYEKDSTATAKVIIEAGFKEYAKLFRMQRTEKIDEPQILNSNVVFAEAYQAKTIMLLLDTWFDKYCEQLPLQTDIERWIDNKQIAVYLVDGHIVGFVIFEINGQTSYLRYWFTHPDFRNRKIGSSLLRRFFYECSNSKRQIFWVLKNNQNAVERYRHYGFKFEPLTDIVMTSF